MSLEHGRQAEGCPVSSQLLIARIAAEWPSLVHETPTPEGAPTYGQPFIDVPTQSPSTSFNHTSAIASPSRSRRTTRISGWSG